METGAIFDGGHPGAIYIGFPFLCFSGMCSECSILLEGPILLQSDQFMCRDTHNASIALGIIGVWKQGA